MNRSRTKVRVIADSVWNGSRITTMQGRWRRAVHPQFMTYRLFARNARSSRAVPTKTLLKEVLRDPALPVKWGRNQAGMQAREELTGWRRLAAKALYAGSRFLMVAVVWALHRLGLHKEEANRLIEPWMWIDVVFTATEESHGKKPWDNFIDQRLHEDAQADMQELAREIKNALDTSRPADRQTHTPYAMLRVASTEEDMRVSAARCARVSYKPFGADKEDRNKDIRLANRLEADGHWSPFEHVAQAEEGQHGVLNGWQSLRDKKGA